MVARAAAPELFETSELRGTAIGWAAGPRPVYPPAVNLVESVAPARLGRSFRWLLGSVVVANIGDGIALAAGPLLVASETASDRARGAGA